LDTKRKVKEAHRGANHKPTPPPSEVVWKLKGGLAARGGEDNPDKEEVGKRGRTRPRQVCDPEKGFEITALIGEESRRTVSCTGKKRPPRRGGRTARGADVGEVHGRKTPRGRERPHTKEDSWSLTDKSDTSQSKLNRVDGDGGRGATTGDNRRDCRIGIDVGDAHQALNSGKTTRESPSLNPDIQFGKDLAGSITLRLRTAGHTAPYNEQTYS